jgi:hypothetical protein
MLHVSQQLIAPEQTPNKTAHAQMLPGTTWLFPRMDAAGWKCSAFAEQSTQLCVLLQALAIE